jgi:DNA polymerase III epsilon subunit-like protein
LTENKPELHLHVKYMKKRTLVKVFIKFKKMNKKMSKFLILDIETTAFTAGGKIVEIGIVSN